MGDVLIPDIYEAALVPERWNAVFERIASELDGAAVYLGHSATARFGFGDFWTVGVDAMEWNRVGESEQSAQANRTLSILLGCEGRIFDRRAIVPDEEVAENPLSRIFLTENGLFHAALSVVQRDDEFASTFWVARDRARPIEGASIDLLGSLAPHVGQAMRIHRALGRSAREVSAFRTVLDSLERGVALLDGSLRVVYANAAAERALDADSGIGRRFGRLFVMASPTQMALNALVRRLNDPRGEMRGGALLIPDASGGPAWRLTLAPAVGAYIHGQVHTARIIAFIDDISLDMEGPEPAALTAQLGLTAAEARVATLSARALRPAEIAALLGVSVNTVKSHLKAVHVRLDVSTQAELVRTILAFRDP